MKLRDPRGPPRHGVMGCGVALLLAVPVVVWAGIRSWREGGSATDYVVIGAVCVVVSAIFLWVGSRMTN